MSLIALPLTYVVTIISKKIPSKTWGGIEELFG